MERRSNWAQRLLQFHDNLYRTKICLTFFKRGLRVIECLPSMHKTLGSVPITEEKKIVWASEMAQHVKAVEASLRT